MVYESVTSRLFLRPVGAPRARWSSPAPCFRRSWHRARPGDVRARIHAGLARFNDFCTSLNSILSTDGKRPPSYPQPCVAHGVLLHHLHVRDARASCTARGRPNSPGPRGLRGELQVPEDESTTSQLPPSTRIKCRDATTTCGDVGGSSSRPSSMLRMSAGSKTACPAAS